MCDESCGSCRYFVADPVDNEDDDPDGRCHRFPPVLALPEWEAVEWEEYRNETIGTEDGQWVPRAIHSFTHWSQPYTYSSQWCGEFQARKEDEE